MNKSDSISALAAALVAFRGDITNPRNVADNPFYKSKYAPLSEVINHVNATLAKYGLAAIQNSYSDDGQTVTVTTLLLHKSGEWLESEPLSLKPEKLTPQGAGSVITYARRYQLSAMLGVSSEDDDDGNSFEVQRQAPTPAKAKPAPKPAKEEPVEDNGMITPAQAKRLFALAGKNGTDIVRQVLGEYNIQSSSAVPVLLYDDVCKKVGEMAAKVTRGEA